MSKIVSQKELIELPNVPEIADLKTIRIYYIKAPVPIVDSAATPASRGFLLQGGTVNENALIVGQKSAKNLKFINAVSGSDGVVNAQYNYI